MFDTPENLATAIKLGEDSTLELKRVLLAGARVTAPTRDALANELAAFANGRGGTIVLGVDDKTRTVLGLPVDVLDVVEAWVREACNDSIKPPLDADIRKLELPDSTGTLVPVIRVDVSRSLFVHRSPGGYYRRIGSSNRELSPEVLARLFQERSQTRIVRFDESVVASTTPADLSSDLLAKYFPSRRTPTDDSLRKLRLIEEDLEGTTRLTVSGVLLGTKLPSRWLPNATIQAVGYAGHRQDVNYQEDAREIEGPLDVQVFEALHFVRRNARIAASKSMSRAERPSFSERAIFEALVNAVAHRDYSIAGARIRLHLFRDRLELMSPGGLPNTLEPDSMPLRQYSRNELIVSLLARRPTPEAEGLGRSYMMDRRGDGVPIIIEESTSIAGRPPVYSVVDDSEVRLVIWAPATTPS
ncbi:MAG: RNA-binding domain-containing protein [Chloroflexota bacterium]